MILIIGLALWDIQTTAFLEAGDGNDLPEYIQASQFEIQDFEKLLLKCIPFLPLG